MTIYKVYYERVSADWGRFQGYVTYGYYANKEKAEEVKNSIKPDIVTGDAFIEEIEVTE